MPSKPAARKRELDPYTLRHVARELIGLAEAFYNMPGRTNEDRVRADLLSNRGQLYLRLANAEARGQARSRKALECRAKPKLTPATTLCGPVPATPRKPAKNGRRE